MKLVKVQFLLLLLTCSIIAFGQKSKEVKVKTENGKLYGTLQYPIAKKDIPVVLIIPGSGPTDRDGNSMMVQANSYKMMADSLQKRGIASLRYDKQGIGESAETKMKETELRFENMVADVVTWIEFLKKKKEFSTITLIGHSQGSLLGMLAAQKVKVDGYISLAGAGRSIDEILKKQLNTGAPDHAEDIERILESLRKGDTINTVPAPLMSIFRPGIQPFLISWIKYDPTKEINQLDIPVMVIQGSTDIQVADNEAEILGKAAGVEVQQIDNMNHVLKIAPIDRQENIKTYYDPELPLHHELTPIISSFVKKL